MNLPQRAVLLPRIIVALLLLVEVAIANAQISWVCFEHIGEQDKPMPEFCVSTGLAAPGERETVVVADSAFANILARCERTTNYMGPYASGTYRWIVSRDDSVNGVVVPQVMLEIVNVVRRDATDRGLRVPDLIQRLALRLGA